MYAPKTVAQPQHLVLESTSRSDGFYKQMKVVFGKRSTNGNEEEAPKAQKRIYRLPASLIQLSFNVRKEPSQDAQILRQLVKGTKIDILGRSEGWIEIDGGYVMEFVRAWDGSGEKIRMRRISATLPVISDHYNCAKWMLLAGAGMMPLGGIFPTGHFARRGSCLPQSDGRLKDVSARLPINRLPCSSGNACIICLCKEVNAPVVAECNIEV